MDGLVDREAAGALDGLKGTAVEGLAVDGAGGRTEPAAAGLHGDSACVDAAGGADGGLAEDRKELC